jgi:hypothetical protein
MRLHIVAVRREGNDHERIIGCSPEKAWKRRGDLKHMRKLRNPKLEIFARELAAGKTPEQAGEIADNFSGKPEPVDEFTERLSEMFSQRMKEFFSLFVDAKTTTYQAVLERVKAQGGEGIDIAGAPRGRYRAPLGGSWILVNGWFFRPDIDGPSTLN